MKKHILGLSLAGALVAGLMASTAMAETLTIAEHRQARIDALKAVLPQIEAQTGLDLELVEYPGPDREYLAKILTELRAGTGPDLFTLPNIGSVAEFSTAGYLEPVTDEMKAWDGWNDLFDVAQKLALSDDGNIYIMPTMLQAMQFYYRRDLFEKYGISTEQPKTWKDLLDRAIEAKEKSGQYSLMLPMGVTWGQGAFKEGFLFLLTGTGDPEIVADDGKLKLTSQGMLDVFGFYKSLVDNKLLPVDPLLGPDPWVIPKYQMFPNGELLATSCGSWCYIYDWGPKSSNPLPSVESAVGTWAIPGKDGGERVMVSANHAWAVNTNAIDIDAAKKALLALGSVDVMVSYAEQEGNLPSRKSVEADSRFQALTPLVPIMDGLNSGTFVKAAPGFATVADGIARATEALLLKIPTQPEHRKFLSITSRTRSARTR